MDSKLTKNADSTISGIEEGSLWRHKKTNRVVVVDEVEKPTYLWRHLTLEHGNGKKTQKGVHYFISDYVPYDQGEEGPK